MPVQQFYFAWVDADTPFDDIVHARVDEEIVSFEIEQVETEFATMSANIKNPRIGLLNVGRKLWAWLSYHNGTSIIPIFFGRVVGIPSDLHLNVVTLEFIARPIDFGAQKQTLAATMRFLPFYDPVFIKQEMQLDPDVVLEGRSQVWHIDRTSHEVSVSDLIVGEDGTEEFEEDEVPYNSVRVSFDGTPLRRVRVVADVPWVQKVSGDGLVVLKNWKVDTVAGQGLIGGWPKAEASLGGGWSVSSASAASPYTNLQDIDFGAWWLRGPNPPPGVPFALNFVSAYTASVSQGNVESQGTMFAVIADKVTVNLVAKYEAERDRRDIVTFDLIADSQAIVTDPDDEDYEEISVSGNDVSIADIFANDYEPPIGMSHWRSYFPGERGQQSLQYLINLARAAIVHRSRAVRVEFECTFDRAVDLSLRKNALLNDRRLPGGQAIGKVIGYRIKAEGGKVSGSVIMGCCIGKDGSIVAVAGTPTYVDDGYVAEGYQYMENEIKVLGTSDVGFTPLLENPNDDGLVFPLRAFPFTQNPHNVTVETVPLVENFAPQSSQQSTDVDDCGDTTAVSVSSSIDTGPWTEWLGGVETKVEFRMKAVEGGPFETNYILSLTDLKLPKQIDLEAASNA